ncbi:Gfo/Idh/MocA family protein [Paenibacillus thermoaerophilus]|uniref:Gfo/Idh/MocA family protein n=1 Tax=Paenibacillus thermoaerophilus TaxID=1215385 RepID=A0ABW2V5T7_9BACL|nr:Gfo/Idh/MocA family oxidoreductase [Paenibacillus thermoaerophilus]
MNENKRTVRFGIVGCGIIAELHAEAIRACPHAELAAVIDIDPERSRSFAEKHGIPHAFSDLGDMLSLPEIDVVSICTPSGLHGDAAIQAARSGKHVLCEKPLEITPEKMTAMIEACRNAGVKLGCVYQRRALSVPKAVKRVIEEGKLGKLVLGDAYLKYYRSQAYYDSAGWRGTWALDGGGALMNQGVHGVDMIQWLCGGIQKVYGRTAALSRNIEVEDTAVAVVEFRNGAFGVIEGATTVYPERSTRFEIHGELGTVVFDDNGIQEWHVPGEETPPAKDDPIEGVRSYGHYLFIEDMALAVLEDREPMVPGEEARKAVDIILAIYESSSSKREVIL